MTAHRRLVLASSVVGAAIVALDGSVLTVVQPTLQRELGASLAQVQWTSTAYLVAVASLSVSAGRIGDRYGHQRMFALGMLGFGLASAGVGLAPGVGWVIGLRVVQGVFGALLQPATLGMLRAAFPPDRLGMPIAVRTSVIGIAAAAGPLVGGALVGAVGWRAVFFLSVVPSLVFGVLALTVPGPRQRQPNGVRFDLPGALLLALCLASLIQALVDLPGSAAGLAVSVLAALAFVRHERRTAHPLLPSDVVGPVAIRGALGMLLAASAAFSGTLFVVTYVLQDTRGLGPFQSALRGLPLAAAMVLAAPATAVVLRRAGARRTAGVAMAVVALAVLVLSRSTGTVAVCAGFALLGAGFGTVMVAATQVVVREATVESAGVAGGLKQTAVNVGPTLGVSAGSALLAASGSATALSVLAGVALTGALACLVLPGRTVASLTHHGVTGDRAGVPARR
ncbi:Major Facilitator Superfamily protein [Streptomyces sp. 3213]|uniref:MFS transporter n=1 Tax=Streptomyces sp. 3213.3 TaxID=1855348 RepID=UPI000894E479|nr:MFS transporter [Streptomyces sp. 3213.3]SEE77271.1 Major Facilitator Superfamily protein [Streptomyces sp. 3213] [Streptomyces sp. 3213.3]